ncbi:Proteinase inhibitor I4, serpin [Crocosphaera watsonii WH 8502]|uniref:Proteinase inhibitor I4, serpin n=1 Tax=Crocosphaera watsonii WH 8502 TaxID=423474 RepID=T2IG73_CROWT|nr:Proteinase inhibitor I4, serpin [Crocosphaera watsonii WH 8502]
MELPRSQLKDELNLTNALKELGYSTMFDPDKAEFSQLSSHPTYISGMKHQTILVINEEGVTSPPEDDLLIKKASMDNTKEEFSLTIDRPFLSIIRDNDTGNVLFMGMIYEP